MRYSVKTDKGSVRDSNEDYYNIISGHKGIPDVFLIADGMGGHNAGEIASMTSVECIYAAIMDSPGLLEGDADIPQAVRNLIMKANQAVFEKSLEREENRGMGTTLTMAIFAGSTMYVGHVGDSRLYLVRDGKIQRITTDHSYIEELVKNGSITRKEAEKHPQKNIITRALGCSDELEADTYICGLQPQDCIVMCTDGLTNMVDETEIMNIVTGKTPAEACDELVGNAIRKGGDDNITIIVIKNE